MIMAQHSPRHLSQCCQNFLCIVPTQEMALEHAPFLGDDDEATEALLKALHL